MDYLCPLFDLNIVLIKQPQLRSERVAFPAVAVVSPQTEYMSSKIKGQDCCPVELWHIRGDRAMRHI